MNLFKTLLAKFARAPKPEEAIMTDPIDPITPAVPAAPSQLNTDTLKALLLALGHDVEADWEHLVALAKKVI